MTREIYLSQGKYALVDDEDYEAMAQYKWHYGPRGYAVRRTRIALGERQPGERRRLLFMHRLIMCAPDNLQVDHINHNRLDNRRQNLRIVTHQQNQRNTRRPDGTSRYTGVCFHKATGRWSASICVDRKSFHIGLFADEEAAAKARDREAFMLFGEYAYLNFPEVYR